MKAQIPNSVVYGALALALVAVAAAGFMLLRDKPPTKNVNMVGREQLKGPPPLSAPPAWAMQKFREAAASKSGG